MGLRDQIGSFTYMIYSINADGTGWARLTYMQGNQNAWPSWVPR